MKYFWQRFLVPKSHFNPPHSKSIMYKGTGPLMFTRPSPTSYFHPFHYVTFNVSFFLHSPPPTPLFHPRWIFHIFSVPVIKKEVRSYSAVDWNTNSPLGHVPWTKLWKMCPLRISEFDFDCHLFQFLCSTDTLVQDPLCTSTECRYKNWESREPKSNSENQRGQVFHNLM